MRMRTWCFGAAVICAPASALNAQSPSAAIGYLTLISTPAGAMAPVVKQWMLPEPSRGVSIETQWGHVSGAGGSLDAFTVGAALPLADGRAAVDLSAGLQKPSCDRFDCNGHFLASAGVEGRIIQAESGLATFTLGLSGRIGFAKPTGVTLWTASSSAPLSLTFGKQGGVQFVPFVSPGFGWGRISGGGRAESGTRFMLGGGFGVVGTSSGVGVTLGAQKIFVDGGKTVFGAGITLSRL